jgi:aerobic carbon-monoxide dehydrogenase medium subunit
MKPAPFQYHAPKTVEETVALLAELAPDDGRVLAGGQSLVPTMAFRLARPGHLIDINGVAGLDRLAVQDGRLFIGATVRHAAFEQPAAEGPLGQLLSEVAHHIAHRPIRTRGTFCGSIAHADPASEWCAVAACLDAEMMAISTRGVRLIQAPEFFKGLMTTALDEDELLAEVRLPMLRADVRFGFAEFSRRAGDFAIAMAAVIYRLQDGAIVESRVAIGGAEASPRRIVEAEYALKGRQPSSDAFILAAEIAAKRVEPLDDQNISAQYRRELVLGLTRRALEQAHDRAEPEALP